MRRIAAAALSSLLFSVVTHAKESGQRVLFSSNWVGGIDHRIQIQAPEKDSISWPGKDGAMPSNMLKVSISRDDNYAGVANGTPRAEMSFNGFLHFKRKREYVVHWQTFIPGDYMFDAKQPELFAQIHQGPPAGYPPFAIFISGATQYEVHNRTVSTRDYVTSRFGSPQEDRGRIVHWALRYVPDDTGSRAVTELTKDGKRVFAIYGVPNAYANDDRAYLKLGLYKADWQKKPSDVDVRTLYYGPVSIVEVK